MKSNYSTLLFTFLLIACAPTPETTPTLSVSTTPRTTTPSPEATTDFSHLFMPRTPTPIVLSSTPAAYDGTPFPQPSTVITANNAHQIVELAQWGRGIIQDIAYSPDGESVVVTTSNGIYIHDRNDFDAPPEVIHVDGPAVLSDDMTLLATTEHVIRLSDQKVLLEFPNVVRPPLKFSPNGRYIAVIRDGDLLIWEINEPNTQIEFSFKYSPHVIQFSPDEKTIAISQRGLVRLYDLELEKELTITRSPVWGKNNDRYALTLAFSSDGGILVSGYAPGVYFDESRDAVDVFNLSDDKFLYSIPSIRMQLNPRGFNCDTDMWTFEPPPPSAAEHVSITPNGKLLAVVYRDSVENQDFTQDSRLIIYRVSDGAVLKKFGYGANSVAFSPDGRKILVASNDGIIEEWSTNEFAITGEIFGYNGKVIDVSFSPDNSLLGIEFFDHARLQNIQDASIMQDYPDAQIAFAPNGQTFALGYRAGHIQFRDIGTRELIKTIFAHDDDILDIVYLPSGDLISTAADCTTFRWEMPSGKKMFSFDDYIGEKCFVNPGRERLLKLTASIYGNYLIGSDWCELYAVWDTNTGERVITFPGTDTPLDFKIRNYSSMSSALQVMAIGDVLDYTDLWEDAAYETASALSLGLQLFISWRWRYPNPGIIIQLVENLDIVADWYVPQTVFTSIVFSSDGTFFITTATDGTIRMWGIAP